MSATTDQSLGYMYQYAWDEVSKTWATVGGYYTSPSESKSLGAARAALPKSIVPAGGTKAASAVQYFFNPLPGQGWQKYEATTIVVYGWSTGAEKETVERW